MKSLAESGKNEKIYLDYGENPLTPETAYYVRMYGIDAATVMMSIVEGGGNERNTPGLPPIDPEAIYG